jgi:EmrB/QacA subfamily drug resistance transporter
MHRHRGPVVLVILCVAQAMLIVDIVALNVALPSIQRGLGIGAGHLQLAGIAYTLTFGSLLIVAGRAGDVVGRRRLFQVGLAVFTVASAVTAAAQNGPWLFTGRALQGIGAAMVSPTALALITSMFDEGENRNRALGVFAAVGSAGAIAGQLLGGVLTDAFGWRSIFLINVPIGVLTIMLTPALVPEFTGQRVPLDVRGAALLGCAVASFTLLLTRVAEHGFDPVVLTASIVALLAAMAFVRAERRHAAPLLQLALFRNRGVRSGNAVLALLAGGTTAALFFTTLYMQTVLGYSPLAVGAAFAPVTLIVLAVSPFAGRLAGRVGARSLLVAGAGLSGGGLVVLASASVAGSYLSDVLPGLALVALGNGLAYAPTMIAGTSGVVESNQGFASGLLSTSQELGSAFGLAVAAPIAAAVIRASDLTDAAAMTAGYRMGFLVAAALNCLAATAAWRTPRQLGRMAQADRSAPDGDDLGVEPSARAS